MPTNDVESNYFSGQGVVLIASRDPTTGLPKGFVPVGNVSDLKVSVSTSVLEHKESQSGQRAIDLRLTTETKCALSMTMENFSKENLAMALRGTVTEVPGGTVVDEVVKAYLGKVINLAHIKVSNVVVEDGITPLTVNVDYTVNTDAGSIKLAAAIAGVVEEDNLNVSYDYAAQEEIASLTEGSTERYLRFEGLNTADSNKPTVVEVFKFSTDPLKELALIGDAIGQFVLEGNVLSDSLRTSGSKFFRQVAVA